MKKWLFLLLLPSLVLAGIQPFNLRKDPIYVDVEPQKIILYPEKTEIPAAEIGRPGNSFELFLNDVERVSATRYIILVVRPGSARLQRQLRQLIRGRNIEVGIEPWEADREIVPDEMTEMNALGQDELPSGTPGDLFQAYQKVAGDQPCELELSADSLKILKDNSVVHPGDLKTPGNAFERLVDQCEAEGRTIVFCKQPGGETLFWNVLLYIQERAPKMAGRMGLVKQSYTVLKGTPIEALAHDKSPVFFECRNNQLFPISIENIQKACAEKSAELKAAANNDQNEFLKLAARTTLEVDGRPIDFTYALMNRFVLLPPRNAQDDLPDGEKPAPGGTGYGVKLAAIDPQKQFICLFVRPDGFNLFRKVRNAAWELGLETSCELMDEKEIIMLGPEGKPIFQP